jgi:hypothetical protein
MSKPQIPLTPILPLERILELATSALIQDREKRCACSSHTFFRIFLPSRVEAAFAKHPPWGARRHKPIRPQAVIGRSDDKSRQTWPPRRSESSVPQLLISFAQPKSRCFLPAEGLGVGNVFDPPFAADSAPPRSVPLGGRGADRAGCRNHKLR